VKRPYELQNFLQKLDEWGDWEDADTDLRIAVLDWMFRVREDPYSGARRETNFPNLWFARIPGTARDWEVVVCSYWIAESEHVVRCDNFATLNFPV
jgi:hypothetical protein